MSAMQAFEIRPAERFPEPAFSSLQRDVFADVQQPLDELGEILREERGAQPGTPHAFSPSMFRLGAYCGAELIGWSCGWLERGATFYMANSGVVAQFRRRGVYSALLDAVREHAVRQGAVVLRSHHSVINNAVIIAKLRRGFFISGLSQSAQMGTLVELVHHLTVARDALYRRRALPYVAADSHAGSTDRPAGASACQVAHST